MKTITHAEIRNLKTGPPDFTNFKLPHVWVIMSGEEDWQPLFSYYPDELTFHTSEFIGLTREEALHLKFTKDHAFMRVIY